MPTLAEEELDGVASVNTFVCTNKMKFACAGERGGCRNGYMGGEGGGPLDVWPLPLGFSQPPQKNNSYY